MSNSKWQYSGDVNMLDYGGKNMRCIGARRYQIIELINMLDATGELPDCGKYNVSLRMVDLSQLSEKNIQDSLRCCGQENQTKLSDDAIAECCDSYGCHAPLEQWNGNNARQLLRQAYRAAKELLDDTALSTALEKPVNKIGSTAMEFMKGDIFSPIQRGCESKGAAKETDPDTAAEYFRGYERGQNVKAGKCPAPSWIKESKAA